MAETSKNGSYNPTGAASSELPLPGFPGNPAELPEHAGSTRDPRLNRSAEVIGRGVGSAVYGIRQFPRQVQAARRRLQIVGGRARTQASSSAFDLVDAASERATLLKQRAARTTSSWRAEANSRLSHLRSSVRRTADDIRSRAQDRLQDIEWQASAKWDEARHSAQERLTAARREAEYWRREKPLETLAVIAAGAFICGVVLRIGRSTRD